MNVPSKTPLDQASLDLSAVAKMVEEQEETIDNALLRIFGECRDVQVQAVDRNIIFSRVLEHQIACAKEMEDAWTAKVRTLKNIQERHKARLVSILQSLPDIPFKGTQGKIALHANPVALEVEIAEQTRCFKVIGDAEIAKHRIPVEFLDEIRLTALNKANIKAHIKSGKELSWARLKQDNHIRIRL